MAWVKLKNLKQFKFAMIWFCSSRVATISGFACGGILFLKSLILVNFDEFAPANHFLQFWPLMGRQKEIE